MSIWNTVEQYAGLISGAASPFFEISSQKSQKSQNRAFLQNEQYGRLESQNRPFWPAQAARSRGFEGLDPCRIQGTKGPWNGQKP